jgi:hypothetical protein
MSMEDAAQVPDQSADATNRRKFLADSSLAAADEALTPKSIDLDKMSY